MVGMEDPRAAEGVEHLQGAARELLKAARSFLDVIEEVVEDPERLTGAASGLADVVRSGLGRREAPWQHAAWQDDPPAGNDEPAGDDEPDEPGHDGDRATGAARDEHLDEVHLSDEADRSTRPPPAAPSRASAATAATTPRTSRVRRIAVD